MKRLRLAFAAWSRRRGSSRTRAGPRQHAVTLPFLNLRSALTTRRPARLFLFLAAALAALLSGLPALAQTATVDYDDDNDRLIEVASLAQLNALRWDLNGDGSPDAANAADYRAAFPNAVSGMGCPSTGCIGYELTADLDFDTNGNGAADAGDTYWNGGSGWHPIGNRYSAVFDGNGHTISNIYIRRTFSNSLGLFGHVSGHIRNLGVKDAYIDGNSRVGMVAGSASGLVSSTYATGRILGTGHRIGGLVGELSGNVVAAWTDVEIVTQPFTRSFLYYGGIVGCAYSNGPADGVVRASYALGSITEAAPYGTNRTTWHPVVHLCSGGSDNYEPGTNSNSYFDGNRALSQAAGYLRVSDQWARSTESLVRPTGYTGIYANWNVNVRGDAAVDDPWDFGTNRDYPKLKADKNGDGVYTVEEFPGQDQVPGGSTDYDLDNDNLIEIANMLQLNAVRFDVDGDGDVLWSRSPQYPEAFTDAVVGMGCPDVCRGYELANDIDHDANGNGQLDGGDWPYDEGAGFRPIGHDDDAPYTAEFNGNGYAIRNLNIHRSAKYTGLFGHISGQAYIHHVGLNDVSITSSAQDVGALVGFAEGDQARISAVYATGTVQGADQTGGLVGSNAGVVRAAWADVTVTGNSNVGGLAGYNSGDIGASYSRGSAAGSSNVHGAVGSTIQGGSLSAVYFDRNSHPAATDTIHPKLRTELQEPTGYTGIYSGWNADLDGDGSADDPWDFGETSHYPVLKTDRDGDGTATWEEFGDQARVSSRPSGPAGYDLDLDGLIEVSSLQQLNAIRYDLNGDGQVDSIRSDLYQAAFPNRQIIQPGDTRSMGCPSTGCIGYELIVNLDFDENGDGIRNDTYTTGDGWHPIGNTGNWGDRASWYSAIFDGNGHTISNMYIRRTFAHYLGLFGHVSGHIRNLGMEDAYIDGGTRVGIIAGSVGNNHSQLDQHSGTAALGSVSVSYATGRIVGNGSRIGGLVGELSGYVVATWADVRVETPPYTRPYPYFGGIAGCVYSNGAADGTVRASYSLGSIVETIPDNRIEGHPVAHLCSGGSNNYEPGVIADSYFDGNRHIENDTWARSTGELVSPTDYTGIYANWNVNVRGDSNADDPWDFGAADEYPKLKADKNGDGVYTVAEFSGQDQEPLGDTAYDTDGDGLIEITSMVQLNAIRFDPDGNGDVLWSSAPQYPEAFPDAQYGMGCPDNVCSGYELANDIDHDANGNGQLDGGDWPYDEGAGFRPIGHDDDAPYTAEFNGNGYAIRNLNIHRSAKYTGLFGHISGQAYIHHVGLNDVSITSSAQDVGALVGFAEGDQARISAVYATGTVQGADQTGGLVGSNAGVVRAAWTDVTVTGGQHVGGLAGYNSGDIGASYSRGTASGSSNVHGAVGLTIQGGSLSAVYFDRNSHQTVTEQIHPKTPAELQEPIGYTGIYSGWNADLDGDESADDPWDFGASTNYPLLKTDRDGDGTASWREFGDQARVSAPPPTDVRIDSPQSSAFTVHWTSPSGVPPATLYDLRYRVDGATTWSNGPQGAGGNSASIAGLASNTVYEVQAKVIGSDLWSDSAYGATTVPNAVFSAILTVGTFGANTRGYSASSGYGAISDSSFELQDITYNINNLSYRSNRVDGVLQWTYRLIFDDNPELPAQFKLHLDSSELDWGPDSLSVSGHYAETLSSNLDPTGSWVEGQRVAVSIAPYTIQFQEANYRSSEGRQLRVTVEFSDDDGSERSVKYRLRSSYDCFPDDQFKADASDFGADLSGTAALPQSTGPQRISTVGFIEVVDDDIDEADSEFACLELYDPVNAVLGARTVALIRVFDNDVDPNTVWPDELRAESAQFIDTGFLAPGKGGTTDREENPDGYGSLVGGQFTIDGIDYSVIKLTSFESASGTNTFHFRTEPALPQSVVDTHNLYLTDTSGVTVGGILTRDATQVDTYSFVESTAILPDRLYLIRLRHDPDAAKLSIEPVQGRVDPGQPARFRINVETQNESPSDRTVNIAVSAENIAGFSFDATTVELTGLQPENNVASVEFDVPTTGAPSNTVGSVTVELRPSSDDKYRLHDRLPTRATVGVLKADLIPQNLDVAPGDYASLVATWDPPDADAAAVTGYDLRLRQVGESGWTEGPTEMAASPRSHTYRGLAADTEYEVQVRARRGSEITPWSPAARGTPVIPPDAIRNHLWSATMTVGTGGTVKGYNEVQPGLAQIGSLGADSFAASLFEIGGTGYRVGQLAQLGSENLRLIIRSNVRNTFGNRPIPAHDYVLRIGDSEFVFHGSSSYGASIEAYQFALAGLSLAHGQTIRVSLWGIGPPSVFGLSHVDYDTDNNNLIDVRTPQQLFAIRYDFDGDGAWESEPYGNAHQMYNGAFPHRKPNSAGGNMMGCPGTCKGYELKSDIDLSAYRQGAGWLPIGNQRGNFFSAEFDGNGHTISNLRINRPTESYVGLFGHTAGFLHHVGLQNVWVKGDAYVGGLAGSVGSNSWSPVMHAGGGTDFGAVAASYVTGRVEGRAQVGGLVGQLGGYLVASWTNVHVVGTQFIGGVAGCVFKIRLVEMSGLLNIKWDRVQGADGTVSASYALGNIWPGEPQNAHPVSFSCNGYWNHNRHNITESGVQISERVPGARDNSYFNSDIHRSAVAEGKATYELAFPIGYTGIFAGWNVDTNRISGGDLPWDFGTNRDYPKLRADRNGDGIYTVAEFPGQDQQLPTLGSTDYDTDNDNLIEVSTMAQLNAIRFDPDGDGFVSFQGAPQYPQAFPDAMFGMGCPDACRGYELAADLDHDTNGNGRFDGGDWPYDGGAGFRPIGHDDDTSYTAEFHGNGYAIYNLNIHRTAKYTGLFGHISGTAYIHHVGLNDVNITSSAQDVGALVGFAQGNQLRISANYATGSVTGANQTGGLVGSNQGFMLSNWAEVTVNGGTNVGGLAGYDIGTVSAGYARGTTVTGTSRVNGVVGRPASGTVHTYYDKTVNTVDHSFGRTTTELRTPTGYTDIYANWNSDLDGDGTADDPWDFGTSSQYPVLKADRNGDGIQSWEEFGFQNRLLSSTLSGLSITRTAGELTSFDLVWHHAQPVAISRLYEVRYRIAGQPNWQQGPRNFRGVAATVSGLQIRTLYEFQARVANIGTWSDSVYGITGAPDAFHTAVLTVGRDGDSFGYRAGGTGFGSLESNTFTLNGTTYTVSRVTNDPVTGGEDPYIITLRASLPPGGAVLRVGGLGFTVEAGQGSGEQDYSFPTTDLGWTDGRKIAFVLLRPPVPLPVLSISSPTVSESGGQMRFRVSLNNASAETVTVDYAIDTQASTAVAGVDYQTLQAGTLTFAPGDTRRTVSLTVIDDDVEEALHETVALKLTNAVNAAFPDDALSLSSTGRITDNDGANADQNSPPRITSVYFNEGARVGPKSSVTNTFSGTRFTVGYRVSDRDDPKWDRNKNGIHDEDGLPVQKDAGLDRKCLKWSGGLEPLDPTGYGQLGDCLYIGHNTAWLVAPHVTPEQMTTGENCMEFTAIAVDKKGARRARTESLCVTPPNPTVQVRTWGYVTEGRTAFMSGTLRYNGDASGVYGEPFYTNGDPNGSYGGFFYEYSGRTWDYTFPVTFLWEQIEGPTVMEDTTRGWAEFRAPQVTEDTTLKFRLTVTDPDGRTASQEFSFTIHDCDSRPTWVCSGSRANAGGDSSAMPGEPVNLIGTVETDAGEGAGPVRLRWEQMEGPSVGLSGANGDARFVVPRDASPGTAYAFMLTATNEDGESDRDVVSVTVAEPRHADCAGPDLTGTPGAQVTLQGACGASPEGESPPAHAWSQTSGPTVTLDDATRADPSFTIPTDAAYGAALEFELTVTDEDGVSSTDTVTVTVVAPPPTACAGPDVTGAPGEEVTLQGRCSANPHGKWYEMAHAWTQLSGPTVTLDDTTRGDPSFTLPADAADGTTLEFQLEVTDQEEQTDTDTVLVTVDSTPEATPPTACAGPDLEAQPGDIVTLEGTCSTNPHGEWWRMAHLWTQPEGQNIALSDATKGRPTFTVPSDAAPGTVYTFTLTVTDKDEESDSDDMTVTVPGAVVENQAPTFDEAGPATRSILENSAAGTNVGAAITATDPDAGDTLTYSLSGTDAASFGIDAETGQLTTIDGVTYDYETKSSYALTVEANDGNGGTASIAVTVTLADVHEPTPVTDCFTDLGTLSAAVEYTGSWDDDECRAHHQDGAARYFHFTVSEETTVTITLTPESGGALFVSRDTPQNGWGSVPGPGYEHRKSVRRDNGKLVHDGPHVAAAGTGGNTVTLTLAAGVTYTVEAAGTAGGGAFAISFEPQ